MAQSIKLGSDIYLDGSGLLWVRGSIQATDDLDNYNTAEKAGMWYCNGQPANAPVGYGFLLCFSPYTSGVSNCQILFTAGTIYTRSKFGSNNWSNWYKYTGTIVT